MTHSKKIEPSVGESGEMVWNNPHSTISAWFLYVLSWFTLHLVNIWAEQSRKGENL